MADLWYHNNVNLAYSKQLNFSGDVLKVALVSGIYSPDQDHTLYSDFSSYEISNGFGYTIGGVQVSGTVSTQNIYNNIKLDIDNPSWVASGGNIGAFRYGILYDETINSLIYCFDFESNQTALDGASIIINIDPSGLVTIG